MVLLSDVDVNSRGVVRVVSTGAAYIGRASVSLEGRGSRFIIIPGNNEYHALRRSLIIFIEGGGDA